MAVLMRQRRGQKVGAGDSGDPGFVAVPFEQGFAVGEEVRVGQAIVLQDDPFLHLLEKPRNRTTDGEAAAQVCVAEEGLYITGPVHLGLDGPGFLHQGKFTGSVRPGPVRGQEQPARPLLPNGVEHPGGLNRPVENEEEYRGFESGHG